MGGVGSWRHAPACGGRWVELPPAHPPARPPHSSPSKPSMPSPARSTNTSYQRWDEARKMWGLIVNRSRDVARQVRRPRPRARRPPAGAAARQPGLRCRHPPPAALQQPPAHPPTEPRMPPPPLSAAGPGLHPTTLARPHPIDCVSPSCTAAPRRPWATSPTTSPSCRTCSRAGSSPTGESGGSGGAGWPAGGARCPGADCAVPAHCVPLTAAPSAGP